MSDIINQNATFYRIADDLATYFDTLADAEEQLRGELREDQRKEIEQGCAEMRAQIDRLGKDLALKADAVAGVIGRQLSEAKLIALEESRLARRRRLIERSAVWLKEYVIAAMKNAGLTTVRSTTATLKIQGNSGIQPLELDGPLPDEYRDITVRMPLDVWRMVEPEASRSNGGVKIVGIEPSQARIREALNGGKEIEGARLLERGEHLRIT